MMPELDPAKDFEARKVDYFHRDFSHGRLLIEAALPTLSSELSSMLGNARSWTPASLRQLIEDFGPEKWAQEI